MNIVKIIAIIHQMATVNGVPPDLLVAICNYESDGFKQNYSAMDVYSPSFGYCQIKKETAIFLGFKGTEKDLMDPTINAKYSALYLRYQQNRYGSENWCRLAAAYNSGSFFESEKHPGKPKNLEYVKRVQKKLAEDIKDKLSCEEESE